MNLLQDQKLQKEIEKCLSQIPIDFGGGCSLRKATLIAELIRILDTKVSIDIGLYRGRSFFPQVIAHKLFTGGIVYGVDPFSSNHAFQKDLPQLQPDLESWRNKTDFDSLYKDITDNITKWGGQDSSKILRLSSEEASNYFIENDIKAGLIHIDGNHDTDKVINDVHSYLKLLDKKGFIILDDILFESVKPAVKLLKEKKMSLILKVEKDNSDYAIFHHTNFSYHAFICKSVFFLMNLKSLIHRITNKLKKLLGQPVK